MEKADNGRLLSMDFVKVVSKRNIDRKLERIYTESINRIKFLR